jgi:hypothetical protein
VPAARPEARCLVEGNRVERHRATKVRAPGGAGALLHGGEQSAPDPPALDGGVDEQRAQRAGPGVELRDRRRLAFDLRDDRVERAHHVDEQVGRIAEKHRPALGAVVVVPAPVRDRAFDQPQEPRHLVEPPRPQGQAGRLVARKSLPAAHGSKSVTSAAFGRRVRPRAARRDEEREACVHVSGPRVALHRRALRRVERADGVARRGDLAALLSLRTHVAVIRDGTAPAGRSCGAARARGTADAATDGARIGAAVAVMKSKAAAQLGLPFGADIIVSAFTSRRRHDPTEHDAGNHPHQTHPLACHFRYHVHEEGQVRIRRTP